MENKYNAKDVTIFFPTRNRISLLERTLDSIEKYHSDIKVFVGNCSTKKYIDKVSETISRYNFAKEFIYYPDPGMGDVFTELFDKIETKLAICYADDVFLLRKIDNLINFFENDKIQLVALPMIDNIMNAPSIKVAWSVDEHGCVLWDTPTGRCANHVMVRKSFFENHKNFFGPGSNIDNYFHNNSTQEQRIYPNDGAYLYHIRYDDDTRINSVISGDTFRFPLGHPLRKNSNLIKAIDRDKREKEFFDKETKNEK